MGCIDMWLTWLMFCLTTAGHGGMALEVENRSLVPSYSIVWHSPRTFKDARDACGENQYLLNIQAATRLDNIVEKLNSSEPENSTYVWVNAFRIGGFFHWIDPVPQPIAQGKEGVDEQTIMKEPYYFDCLALDIYRQVLANQPCDKTFDVVCINDTKYSPLFNSTAEVKVTLTTNMSPILLSWRLPKLTLTCLGAFTNDTTLRNVPEGKFAYVWTKNDIYLNESFATIQPEKVIELTTITHSPESSQGHYRCGIKALPSGKTVWSDIVTVVLEDFLTIGLSTFTSLKVTPTQFIGRRLETYGTFIRELVKQYSLSSWSYSRALLSLKKK